MKTKIKVLIAEDFQLLLEDLKELINNQVDMQVVGTASTGQDVVQIAEDSIYDIILMDIDMENANAGVEATKIIRSNDRNAKIIFLTVHDTKDTIITAMATGAVDYIVKGIPEKKILEHIRCAYLGEPIMESRIQEIVMQEYKRLHHSEKSLLFFIKNLSDLTLSEREIIRLLLQGKKVREIADLRKVEVVTVKTQISSILKKFGETRTKKLLERLKS